MKLEKYLPIGTVVLLKEGKKRVMIIGFCAIPDGEDKKVFDYSGCLYPEGVIASDKMLLFNHDQIDKIYHLGLIDEEENIFKINLIDALKKNKNETKDKKVEEKEEK